MSEKWSEEWILEKVQEIMMKYKIHGDIGFDEKESHYWRRKFVELGLKMEE